MVYIQTSDSILQKQSNNGINRINSNSNNINSSESHH
jgi:hypothetical protein